MKHLVYMAVGMIAVMLVGCETVTNDGKSDMTVSRMEKEELIPLTPGEVIVATGPKSLWSFNGGDSDCKISSRYAIPSVIDLRCYKKSGHGTFTFGREFNHLDCSSFDEFIVSATNGDGVIKAGLTLDTDIGEIKSDVVTMGGNRFNAFTDLRAELNGASRIKAVKIDLEYVKAGPNGGEITVFALILREADEFKGFQQHWQRFSNLKWKGLLQSEDYKPSFKPRYGLFFSDKDLEEYRKSYGKELKNSLSSLQKYPAPEQFITADAFSSQCTRGYIASQIKEKSGNVEDVLINRIRNLSFPGLVCKNKKLMRLAARYALSMASLKSWNDIPLLDTVGGGVWPAFTQSGYALQLALAMDCAGEMLTRKGRDYVLKAMMLKGVAPITYSLWAREYAFHGNQAMVFLSGKVAALAAFNKEWHRVMPSLEDAKNQADGCFNTVFREDGSYMESFAYLAYTLHVSSPIYEVYSQLKKKPIADVLPENIKKSGKFMQVLASTCNNKKRKTVSIGQSHSWGYMSSTCAAFIAAAAPDSMWGNMYKGIDKARLERGYKAYASANGIRLMNLASQAKNAKRVSRDNLVVLSDCGLASSYRKLGSDPVKIVMVGDAIGVGKKHYDVGSFILEFAGDVFAMDMPVYSGLFSDAQYHNMLVALDENGKLTNSLYYSSPGLYSNKIKRNSMRPRAQGGTTQFQGRVNPSCSWNKGYFDHWERTIDSPTPDQIMITDNYKLGKDASGVAFIWLTYLPCELKNGKVVIIGEYGGVAELTPPTDCQVEIEEFLPTPKVLKGMDLPETHKCKRIIIRKKGKPGQEYKLQVKVALSSSISGK